MPSASYIDIAALDAVRTRFAAGDAVALLSPALDRVIWANGAGAALFGYADVAAITDAEPQIGLPARRQIMATSGYPGIGKDRAITVRLASGLISRAVAFAASEIALPDGEQAILLAHAAPAASWRSPAEAAARAIAGLDLPGQHVAIADAEGGVVAASRDFAALDLKPEALLPLIAEARGGRLAKRAVETSYGACMAGVLRLSDEPRPHFLVVIDEALPAGAVGSPAQQADDATIPAAVAEAVDTPVTEPPAGATPVEVPTAGPGGDEPATLVELQPSGEAPAASDEQAEQPGNADLPAGGAPAEPIAPELPAAPDDASERPIEVAAAPAEEQHALTAHAEAAELASKESEPVPADQAGEPPAESAVEETVAAETGHAPLASAAGSETVHDAAEPAGSSATEPVAEAREIQPAAGEDGVGIEGAQFAAEDEAEREAAATLASVPDRESEATSVEAEPDLEEAEAGDTAVDDAIREAEPAPLPLIQVDRSAAPVTFVWKTDAADRFSELGEDFVKAVGRAAADVIGANFRIAAARLGIDPTDEIAGLIERRAPWSGRAVSWPVAGTDLRVPVDLAALPTYDRDRNFTGFRGFGVARAADAVVDPDATGLKLVEIPAAEQASAAPTETQEAKAEPAGPESDAPRAADPFRGEPPILTIVPKPERRLADKVIRLAEHRHPGIDKNLSPGERSAFREIGDRLKKDSGAPNGRGSPEQPRHADNDAARSGGAAASHDRANDGEGEEPRPAGLVEAKPEQAAAEARPGEQPTVEAQADSPAPGVPATTEPVGDAPTPVEPVSDDAPLTGEQTVVDAPDTADPIAEAEDRIEAADTPALAETADADQTPGEPDAGPAEAITEVAEASSATAGSEAPSVTADEPGAVAAAVKDYIPSAFALGSAAGRAPIDTSILDKLPVPVLIHAGDVLHYANREFLELTGYDDVEELQAAGGLDALFGEPYPADDEAEPGRKLRLRTQEGLEYPVEGFLQSVPWGDGKSLLLSLRRSMRHPVSYHAQPAAPAIAAADPELESRIEEMRAIVDTATDGVVLIAPDGTIRSISSPAEALFGFDSDDVAGKPFSSLFAIESQRAARDYLNGLSDNGVASVLNDGREVIGREAQGRFIPLFMTIGKLPNDSGFCAVVRDITQWKRAEEELTQARAQAERASSQKTDFLARVSHEIRTPLNAIIGFSELMLDEKFGPVGNDRYRDYLRDINRSGNHVLDLVNDLLDISKIEAGQQEMSYEAVSLNDTLGETVAMMQPSANRERVIIRSSFASRLPEVVADLRSVRQIALNLLSNAIRYTPAGGQVIVSTAYEASGDVVMRVRDTGIGMTQAEIEQALKPFKQINALKRARGDGTGLGLPLTKAMVEANRARFMINSTPGEGTLVEISFPSTRVLAD